MGKHLKTYTIDGVDYEVYGEREMYPQVDEYGLRVSEYDFYDVYTESSNILEGEARAPKCLFCVNEGYPFWGLPTKKEVEKFLEDG